MPTPEPEPQRCCSVHVACLCVRVDREGSAWVISALGLREELDQKYPARGERKTPTAAEVYVVTCHIFFIDFFLLVAVYPREGGREGAIGIRFTRLLYRTPCVAEGFAIFT